MKNIVNLVLVGLLLIAGSQAQVQDPNCPYTYQQQLAGFPRGYCIELCSNPIYANCPATIQVPIPSPEYCGLIAAPGSSAVWRQFTYTCEVCRTPNAVGFYFGACSCQFVGCPAGQVCNAGNCQVAPSCATAGCPSTQYCVNNICVAKCTANSCPAGQVCDPAGPCRARTCAEITCPNPLDTCENGACFRKYDNFCSATQPRILRNYCPLTRPTAATCPNAVTAAAARYCGVSTTGDLINFDRIC